MSSKETDLRDERERGRAADAVLDVDRRSRDRLRDRADSQVPPSHGKKSRGPAWHPYRGTTMTAPHGDQDLDRDGIDRAAAEAAAIVAASYLAEVDGRPLSRAQQQMQDRAARLARHWTQQDRKRGRP
jgi:hypothetical protein